MDTTITSKSIYNIQNIIYNIQNFLNFKIGKKNNDINSFDYKKISNNAVLKQILINNYESLLLINIDDFDYLYFYIFYLNNKINIDIFNILIKLSIDLNYLKMVKNLENQIKLKSFKKDKNTFELLCQAYGKNELFNDLRRVYQENKCNTTIESF